MILADAYNDTQVQEFIVIKDPSTKRKLRLGASFVGAFDDRKVSEILGLPEHVRPIGIIALGYPGEKPARLDRIQRDKLVHYERW